MSAIVLPLTGDSDLDEALDDLDLDLDRERLDPSLDFDLLLEEESDDLDLDLCFLFGDRERDLELHKIQGNISVSIFTTAKQIQKILNEIPSYKASHNIPAGPRPSALLL